MLRLKINWSQFDALWTRLDYKRSGDIDFKEFCDFFRDVEDFETLEGTDSLTHPLTHSLTHPLTHSPTHSLTHSLTH